jgi:leader peptidase (prepilin peptidase) / N-methyltransferase
VSAIDIERRIIPNAITYPATVAFAVAVVLGWIAGVGLSPVQGVIGLLGYGGVFLLIAVISRGMGMGDVKLAALIGLVLGSVGLRYVAAAAGVAVLLGGLGGLLALAIGRGRKSTIPFGPYLAAGALVAIVFAQPISDWYLRTFVPA